MGAEELKALIKQSIREVLQEERLALCEILIPYVTEKEMKEIRTKFGSPEHQAREDLVEMTSWIKG